MTSQTGLDKFFKLGVGLLALFALFGMLVFVGNYLIHIVILFGVTLLMTYLLLAPVNLMDSFLRKAIHRILGWIGLGFLEHRVPQLLPRGIAILMVYLLFGVSTVVVSVRFLPLAFEQLYEFSHDFPKYVHEGEDWLLNQGIAQNYFHQEVEKLQSQGEVSLPRQELHRIQTRDKSKPTLKLSPTEKQVIREKVFSTSDRVNNFVKEHVGGTFNNLLKVISTTVAGFVYTLTGMVLVFYFLLDGEKLKNGFIQMLPVEYQYDADRFLSAMHAVMFGYTKGHLILGAATGVYLIIVNSLLGIPYAFFLGMFFAIAQIVPVVGPWVGALPWLLIIHSVEPARLLVVILLILLFQLIKDVWVAPKILGHVVGLHPVIVILSLLVCSKVAGVAGILFAIPLASMVNVFIRFSQQKEFKRFNV